MKKGSFSVVIIVLDSEIELQSDFFVLKRDQSANNLFRHLKRCASGLSVVVCKSGTPHILICFQLISSTSVCAFRVDSFVMEARLVFSLLLLIVNVGNSYKILVYNSKFAHSHSNYLGRVADILVEAGNNVVG